VRLSAPEPGLVFRYSYLWRREHREGREEGVDGGPPPTMTGYRGYTPATDSVMVVRRLSIV
jgi:hypothetical protein